MNKSTSPITTALMVLALIMAGLSACGDDSNSDPSVDTLDAGGASDGVGDTVPPSECSPEDCGGALGMPNYLCDDGVTMAGPGDCELQESGECGWTIVECPAQEYDACEGKACGEECDPCAPGADACPTIAVMWYCDAAGTCVDNDVTCDEDLCADFVCPGTIEPTCEGDNLQEGYAPLCDPATGECTDTPGAPPGLIPCEYGCADGACLPDPGKTYDPCEGKACGDSCSLCDPSDEECTETGEEKACNHTGLCDGSFTVELCEYEVCEPGTQFPSSDGCNSCDCPEEGYTIESQCTEEDCSSCEPGAQFMADDGCNTCTCPDSGNKDEAPCTKMLCPDTCEPGAEFMADDGCNTCTCPDSGNKDEAPCTKMLCPDTCEPGAEFMADDGCNTCTCPDSGNKDEAPCTKMLCPDTCEPGAEFMADDGCNTCTCPDSGNKGEAPCTKMLCPDTCEPGAEFMADDGCNTCTCPESGNKDEAVCTKKACTCKTSDECADTAFCNFGGDDCGAWGQSGVCVAKPEACIGGGAGACGCDGSWATNSCELQAGGVDLMQFGGCQGIDPVALFACGDTECQIEGEFCMISANDIAGPDQPEFYSSCGELPDGCASGDCDCMETQELEACYDGTGYTMMFYPGG